MEIGAVLATAVIAFLLGSVPSGLWVGRLAHGIDVRDHGSGNLGATNVYRTLGRGWGLLVLFLDGFKGWAAVHWVPALAHLVTEGNAGLGVSLVAMAAAALGHMFSPFASFRGGKGVATVAGSWAALAPVALLLALAVWILVFATSRIVSLASVLAALVLPVATALSQGTRGPEAPIFWMAVVVAVLIVVRHRSNLARLRGGREGRLDLRGGSAKPPSSRRTGTS